MKCKSLEELKWFSFNNEWYKLKELSVFQAIAYILENEADSNDDNTLRNLVDEYVQLISKLEDDSAEDIHLHYDQPTEESYIDHNDNTGQDTKVTLVQDIDPFDISIPESEIEDELTRLNIDRIELTEYMGAPISILNALLQLEINKYKSKTGNPLKLKTKPFGDYECFYFKKSDLNKWKSLNTLKKLGLLDANLRPLGKIRQDKLNNLHVTIGVLLHLLVNQSLSERGKQVAFTFGSDVENINELSVYHCIMDNVINEFSSNFPKKSAFLDILKKAKEEFEGSITLK